MDDAERAQALMREIDVELWYITFFIVLIAAMSCLLAAAAVAATFNGWRRRASACHRSDPATTL